MTDIRDASAHTDGFDPRSGSLFFGMSPEDTPYDPDRYDDLFERLYDSDDELPRAPLPLDAPQRASLAQAIDAGLRDGGCDNTLRAAQAWARRETVPWRGLRDALVDRGGFCDCEVLMNVLPPPD